MKKLLKYTLPAVAALFAAPAAHAQDFFDTAQPEKLFNLGVRLGLNTSVNTTAKDAGFNIRNHNSWGLGFDTGVVANINIRNYISLQPGFFFQTRSGEFTYVFDRFSSAGTPDWAMMFGHTRRYAFDIPVMVCVHFNLGENVRWDVELGPYVSLNLKTDADRTYFESNEHPPVDLRHKSADFGFKMGTGFTIAEHYVVGAHYMAGCCDAWKDPVMGGRNKAWTFTVGYDF